MLLLLLLLFGISWAAAGQGIGPAGAKALAESLAPRADPDGRWAFNGAMERLDLSGDNGGPLMGPSPLLLDLPSCPSSAAQQKPQQQRQQQQSLIGIVIRAPGEPRA